jgi:response regulator of citrate/malate metabolism
LINSGFSINFILYLLKKLFRAIIKLKLVKGLVSIVKKDENNEFRDLIEAVIKVKTTAKDRKTRNLDKLKDILRRAAADKKQLTLDELAKELRVSKVTLTRYLNELKK